MSENKIVLNNVIIYLIAFAGTGKLTVAKELMAKTNLRLVDNHLINNPVFSLLPPIGGTTSIPEPIKEKIRIIRGVVFDAICALAPSDFSYIFTNELIEGREGDLKLYNQIESLAKQRNAVFFPVRLTCSAEELQKRIVSGDRKALYKSTDADHVPLKVKTSTVLKPAHPNLLTLEVTEITAVEAADSILAHIMKTIS